MIRNGEVQTFGIFSGIILLIFAVIAYFFFSLSVALFVFISYSILAIFFYLFTKWRYKEIEKLSMYLRKISSGEFSLDVRDNEEGELSILKNEIYKVTLMLSEQSSQLTKDKVYLTDAISDISHQLKTPLTSMMVMADLIEDSRTTPAKRKEFTHNIRMQLERMEWLVSALLKLSKIDAGTIHFKSEPVYMKNIIEKAVAPLLIPIEIRGQTLTIEGEDSAKILGDYNWTAEALGNIIKNCVDHTPEGGSLVISFSENTLFTEVTIQDTGKGIPKEDLPYIFRRFYKGKNASEESVGIGLALAHSIITHQQGDIEVQSEVGVGTQFRITFYKQVI